MLKRRVLLVDDEPGIRLALRKWFERQGWDVDEAKDGATAYGCLEHLHTGYSLVICDVHLPGVSGLDIAARVARQWPALLPRFVFSTGDQLQFGVEHEELRDRTQVLLKPFAFATLHTLIAQLSDTPESLGQSLLPS